MSTARRLMIFGKSYLDKLLKTGPFAGFVLGEKSGSVAACQISSSQDGTYAGVTLGQDGIGDGNKCPLWDADGDYVDIETAAFKANIDYTEGALLLWAKVSGAGVWTDSAVHTLFYLAVNSSNIIEIANDANGRLIFRYKAGGTNVYVFKTGMSETGWMPLGMTWSVTADEMKAFYQGSQEGSTKTGLGTWAGTLSSALIGAQTAAIRSWDGWEAHVWLWNTALSVDQMAALAVR